MGNCLYSRRLGWTVVTNIPRPEWAIVSTSVLGETGKDAQINQTPKSGIVLWELPHLDKGVWKTEKNPVEAVCQVAKPTYVT